MLPSGRLCFHVAIAASIILPACASRDGSSSSPDTAPNNGLDSLQSAAPEAPRVDLAAELDAMSSDQPPLAAGGSLDDLVARQLAKQQQLRSLRDTPRTARTPSPPATPAMLAEGEFPAPDDATFAVDPASRLAPLGARTADPVALARDSSLDWYRAAAAQPAPTILQSPAAPTEPLPAPVAASLSSQGDPVTDLAQRIAAMLREPGTPERPRIADAAAIAAIESLRPGAMTDLDTSASKLASSLSSEDRATLLDARDRLAGRHAEANEELGKLLKAVSPPPSLTIARATLCTRVTGFGAYSPYPSTVFRAGQPIRAIIYVELDHFATRPARDGDQIYADAPIDQQVSVELSQSVSLFQDPGGLLAWHMPAQPITDTGRSRRRDFYLIQRVELPRTLSIGKYNIKVQVKDLVAGAEAEAVIPITVVAQ
jgi:hypothetical protein